MNAHLPFRKNWSSSASVNAGRVIALVMFSFPGMFLADFFRLRYFSIFSIFFLARLKESNIFSSGFPRMQVIFSDSFICILVLGK